jgi:hypothetical protein
VKDARRAQYIARDREIRAFQENLQQGRITIREFLMAAAFHFEPAEEVFRIEELAELVLPLDEARAAFQAVLEIPAPIREQLNDGAGMAAGEGVDPVPPEQELAAAPPVQELAAAQPVQELAAALPVQELAAAPPVQELAAALPVQELAAAPPVQELAAVPPVQAVPQFYNVPDAQEMLPSNLPYQISQCVVVEDVLPAHVEEDCSKCRPSSWDRHGGQLHVQNGELKTFLRMGKST